MPLVDLVWYPTDKPFLPFPTVFNAKKYSDNGANKDGLGEVWYPSVPKPNFKKAIPGLPPDHYCGQASQFMFGQGQPADPPTVYDADNIPLCCRRGPAAFVGVGVRPAAVVTLDERYPTRTTAALRPAAVVTQTHTPAARVGVGVRPAALVEVIPQTPVSVGLGVRPAAVVTMTHAPPAEVGVGVRPMAVAPTPIVVTPRVSLAVRPAYTIAQGSGCQRETPNCGAALTGPLNLLCYAQVPTPGFRWWRWDYGGGPNWVFRTGRGTLASYSGEYIIYAGNDCSSLEIVASGTGMPLFTDWPLPSSKTRVYVRQFFFESPIGIPDIRWGTFLTA